MRRLIVAALLLAGCYTHRVDTVAEWCEQISDVNLEEKYRPFWAVVFAISFDGDAIRDDFVKFLDKIHMEKVQHRAPRMAWREGTVLHLVNLSSLLVVNPEEIITGWRRGIEAAYSAKDPADICLYGTLAAMFDALHVHSMTADALGRNWKDNVTIISTDRERRLGKDRL